MVQQLKGRKKSHRAANFSGGKMPLTRWLSDHLDSCLDSLGRFLRSPLQSLMTLLVIAVALSLPSMLYLLVKTADANIADIHQTADISVYFKPGTPQQVSLRVQTSVLSLPAVKAARFLPPEKALEEFQQYSGLGETLAYLSDNPLPATLLVTPDIQLQDVEGLLSSIEKMESVDQVQFDYLWLQRLESLLAIIERAVLILAALLGMGVILILGNTIRLEIESRRDEVIVIKLVGGTDAFVRRPLLYAGVWYGVIGALIAWFITNLFALLMAEPLRALSHLYFAKSSLIGLDSLELVVLLVTGLFLGLLGAWLAVARHLSDIEPK